ncbi:MAG: hypothetical protein GY737_01180 [Desulfobacteraceae bacterium]|nr:hypothetical protein [Desulfobacteraceae bacterium]
MTFEEIKAAVLKLSDEDQKRLIMEIIPLIMPKACADNTCVQKIRDLVDEESVRSYRDQHMNGI